MSASRSNDYNYRNDEGDEDDDSGTRTVWEILSWIAVVLTIILNLVLVGIILVRRNAYTVINKVILFVGVVDLLYGIFVSPFFVENYVNLQWDRGEGYCYFFTYFFSFHDLFVPLMLILLSTYISLKFSGILEVWSFKRVLYIVGFLLALLVAILLAIFPTISADIFPILPKGASRQMSSSSDRLQQCRSLDTYTMTVVFWLSSAVLFCFTMSFLFSLCIIGSPLLRDTYDREEYRQRWRLLLTMSIVNGLYIDTGFFLNFKESARLSFECCQFKEPFATVDNLTYDVFSFVLLLCEPLLRPLATLGFYYKYLLNDISAY